MNTLPVFLSFKNHKTPHNYQHTYTYNGRDTVNISGYQKFQYDFLTTGDSKERLEKAAEEVTGRRLVMTFDNNGDTAESKDKSDPVSDFLSRAEKMGVKIKYKKPKN